jgi:predicted flap endonuclease-1-like 5' DNA nuclease
LPEAVAAGWPVPAGFDYNRPIDAGMPGMPVGRAVFVAPKHRAAALSIFFAFLAVLAALGIGFAVGRSRRVADAPPGESSTSASAQLELAAAQSELATAQSALAAAQSELAAAQSEFAAAQSELAATRSELAQASAEHMRLTDSLAQANADVTRYRQLVVDIENNAPPPLFGVGAPDDLKLIVGVGPVLERMLHQLGVTTFRQIAHWSERDIDEFDAKLAEFPGRIRRDAWVTQARELHLSKYGEALPARGH